MKTTKSQCALILKHLKSGKKISALTALRLYGCLRLGGRIHDLKTGNHDGNKWNILSKMIKVGNKHVAQYSMGRPQKLFVYKYRFIRSPDNNVAEIYL